MSQSPHRHLPKHKSILGILFLITNLIFGITLLITSFFLAGFIFLVIASVLVVMFIVNTIKQKLSKNNKSNTQYQDGSVIDIEYEDISNKRTQHHHDKKHDG